MTKKLLVSLLLIVFSAGAALAQEAVQDTAGPPPPAPVVAPEPPTNVQVADRPNDAGHGLIVRWDLSADDGAGRNNVQTYELFRSASPDGEYISRMVLPKGVKEYVDFDETEPSEEFPNPTFMPPASTWYYKLIATDTLKMNSEFSQVASGTTKENWIHTGKIPIMVAAVIFTVFLLDVYLLCQERQKDVCQTAGRHQRRR